MSLPETRPWILLSAVLFCAACADSPVEPLADGAPSRLTPSFVVSGTTFDDPFDALDASRWSAESHTLGRGPLLASNVSVANGALRLATTRDGYTGAEVASREWYGWGRYTASLRCAAPVGTLCAFFLYQGGTRRADEIDIEIQSGTRTIYFTTWVHGRRTNSVTATLAFDPAAALHDYGIEYRGDRVAFTVDGKATTTFRRKLPSRAMLLMANSWWPTWLEPGSATSGVMELDRVVAEP